jgi:hypothetical protein
MNTGERRGQIVELAGEITKGQSAGKHGVKNLRAQSQLRSRRKTFTGQALRLENCFCPRSSHIAT